MVVLAAAALSGGLEALGCAGPAFGRIENLSFVALADAGRVRQLIDRCRVQPVCAPEFAMT